MWTGKPSSVPDPPSLKSFMTDSCHAQQHWQRNGGHEMRNQLKNLLPSIDVINSYQESNAFYCNSHPATPPN